MTLFDHGVLIDYASTDRSVEICRKLAPHWEVRKSRNAEFDAVRCDEEVMDIERAFRDCWKIALNTTEFFCTRDMTRFLDDLARIDWSAYAIQGLHLIDLTPDRFSYPDLDNDRPLISQRSHGVFDQGMLRIGGRGLSRSRILHRHDHGQYGPGRHFSTLIPYMHPEGAQIRHFLYSPMVESFIRRKLQIQNRIPSADKFKGLGAHHLMTEAQMSETWIAHQNLSEDLSAHPAFSGMTALAEYDPTAERGTDRYFPALGYIYGGGLPRHQSKWLSSR